MVGRQPDRKGARHPRRQTPLTPRRKRQQRTGLRENRRLPPASAQNRRLKTCRESLSSLHLCSKFTQFLPQLRPLLLIEKVGHRGGQFHKPPSRHLNLTLCELRRQFRLQFLDLTLEPRTNCGIRPQANDELRNGKALGTIDENRPDPCGNLFEIVCSRWCCRGISSRSIRFANSLRRRRRYHDPQLCRTDFLGQLINLAPPSSAAVRHRKENLLPKETAKPTVALRFLRILRQCLLDNLTRRAFNAFLGKFLLHWLQRENFSQKL